LQKARSFFPEATLCAIGGISTASIPTLKACGIDAVAVISSLFAVDDIEAEARSMVAAWQG